MDSLEASVTLGAWEQSAVLVIRVCAATEWHLRNNVLIHNHTVVHRLVRARPQEFRVVFVKVLREWSVSQSRTGKCITITEDQQIIHLFIAHLCVNRVGGRSGMRVLMFVVAAILIMEVKEGEGSLQCGGEGKRRDCGR